MEKVAILRNAIHLALFVQTRCRGIPLRQRNQLSIFRQRCHDFRKWFPTASQLDEETGIRDGYCYLYTYDRTVAEKYGMVHADELLNDVEQDSGPESDGVS